LASPEIVVLFRTMSGCFGTGRTDAGEAGVTADGAGETGLAATDDIPAGGDWADASAVAAGCVDAATGAGWRELSTVVGPECAWAREWVA
jgi:hypothetical protein